MKILIIAHKVPYPPRGGATLRNYNLLKECAENNEIHLVTFTQEPYLRDSAKLQESIAELKKHCKEVKVFRIPTDGKKWLWYLLLFFNLFSLTPYSIWRFRSKAMERAVKEQLQSYSFDAVEIGCISLYHYVKLVPKLPKLLIHHNIESQLLFRRSKTEKGWLARLYLAFQAFKLKRLEIRASKVFDAHTSVSQLDKNTLLEHCPEAKITVVENGVDPEYFKPQKEQTQANTLIYAGGMSWYPNASAMLYFARKIWPLLKKEIPDIKMNIIGGNPPSELTEFAAKEADFNLLGFVDDVRPYISNAAVYVVPITVGGGTRLKILDALAMGKAIVSTSIGCEGIAVKDGDSILIADDPETFCQKVVLALNDPKLRNKLETNGRELAVEKYSWKKIAPKLDSVYSYLGGLRK